MNPKPVIELGRADEILNEARTLAKHQDIPFMDALKLVIENRFERNTPTNKPQNHTNPSPTLRKNNHQEGRSNADEGQKR